MVTLCTALALLICVVLRSYILHLSTEEAEVNVKVKRRGRRRGGGESEEWIGERVGVDALDRA